MKNIHNSTKQNIFRCLALFLIILGAFVCANFSFAQSVVSAYAQDYTIVGDMTNNVVFVNFKGEDSSYNLYKNSYTTFDTLFNSGEYSVKNYYLANSNNKLNMTADIISSDNTNITIYKADKERTYYMPYMIKKTDWTIETNSDGYFDYYLIKGTNWNTSTYIGMFNMYLNATLVAKVYSLSGAPVDSDPSDKIMSYNEAVAYASANSCTVVSSFERYFREYELLCDIMEQAGSSIDDANSDMDNDNTVDCLSYALLNDQTAATYDVQHSDLLWPHMGNIAYMSQYSSYLSPKKTQLKQKLVNMFGFKSTDVDTLFGYVQNKPTTKSGLTFGNVYMSDYDMYDLSSQNKWESFVVKNTTECHELGHILGLGDLYLGSSDTSLVGSWSHMCNSHQTNASFFTSYEREKLGWLDSTNIGTIKYKGEYTIQTVKGKDGNNRIAYKYNVPNTNEAVYFEYRAPNRKSGFDDFCGSKQGLLVYTTNITELTDNQFSGNNQAKNYYELYINRKSGVNIYYATLGLNESMGSLDKSTTKDAILYSMKTDGTYKNTGLYVIVTAINDDSLTFKILSNDLQAKNVITKANLGGNEALYNKLLAQANDSNELIKESFQGVEKLDISGCNVSDLSFLDLFDLSSIKYINLCDNNLQISGINPTKLIGYSFSKVYLSNNFINLKNIPSSIITNSIFEWGLQKTTTNTIFVNNSPTILYYYSSFNAGVVKLNGTELSTCSTSAIEYTLNEFGECKFVVEFSDGIFASAKYEYTVTNINISSKYDSESNTVKVVKDASLPSFENLITCKGISVSLLKITGQYPSTNEVGLNSFVLSLSYLDESINVVVYYEVFNVKVEFVDTESVYAIGETYTEQYIKIYENDILQQDYTFNKNGNKKTYYVNYYVLDDGNRITTPKITTNAEAEFVVEYVITTSFGERITKEKTIVVSDDIIKQHLMDATLYRELTKITNKEYVYKSDFSKMQSIDLSNKGLSSIWGLKLILTDTMIVNLCDNNLDNLTEIDEIYASSNAKLLLIFNNFENITATYSNCVFGVQNIQRYYLSSGDKVEIANIYEDYSTYFDLSFGDYEISNGKIWQKTFRTNIACMFTLKGTGTSYQKLVDNICINNKKNEIVKEFSDALLYNFDDLFEIKGISSQTLNITNNYQSIESSLSKVGSYTLESVFAYNDKTLQLDITIQVINTKELTKVSEVEKEVYIQSQEQYDKLFASEECVYFDEYEQKQVKAKGKALTLNGYGSYNVEFSIAASSGKITNFTRVVHYGNVKLNYLSSKEQYNTAFELPLSITEFNASDLNISYKYDDSQWQTYNNEISLKKYGDISLTIQISHIKNSNVVFNLNYLVKIVDEISPQITLIGQSSVTNWAGQNYVEAGYRVTDNSTLQVLTNQNETEDLTLTISYLYQAPDATNFVQVKGIDNTKIGTYKIKYKATDKFGNVANEERIVYVVYAPIEQVEINEKLLLSQYSQNKKIEFSANAISDFITDPNVQLNWYINDELINCVGGVFTYTFKDAGEYVVYATLSTDESISTQVVTITVYTKSEYENLVLYIGLGLGAVTLVGFGAFFIGVYRKRNFY